MYVRFGGEYWETYHRNMTRRRVLSLHNQVVKALNSNFSEKKALAFLYKLEKATTELAVLNRQVIDLTNECRELWLPK